MAKVRIGYGKTFEVENERVGVGTDNPSVTLELTGQLTAKDIIFTGVSTSTTVDGFIDHKASVSGDTLDLVSQSHALSGEIIIDGEVTVSSGTTFTSGPENLTVTDNFTLPGISNDKPTVGTTRFNENLKALEFLSLIHI